jgi:hypothetical protein
MIITKELLKDLVAKPINAAKPKIITNTLLKPKIALLLCFSIQFLCHFH